MKTQKVAIYVRVSTSGQTVENQERELLAHCQRQGWQAFKVYRDKDWAWLNQDGGIWKWVTGKDGFEAVMKQYWQIGLDRRNSQGLLSDITEA